LDRPVHAPLRFEWPVTIPQARPKLEATGRRDERAMVIAANQRY